MPRTSAGIVLYRRRNTSIEVLLGHLGGPLWARKDDGAWSIPKGEYVSEGPDSEAPFDAARREFAEELGSAPPVDGYVELGVITQANRKQVIAWAVEGDWPPRSGRRQAYPETDRAAWFDLATARSKSVRGQATLFDRLSERLR